MPEISETPEITYCATALAKTYRDPNEFASLHDALGSLYNAAQLAKIEELASKYTELPELILDRKIEWLHSHGFKPINLETVFLSKNGSDSKSAASKGGDGNRSGDKKDEDPPTHTEDAPSQSKTQTANSRKKNKKGKKKKNQVSDEAIGVQVEKSQEEFGLMAEPEEATPSVSSISSAKRKKKKKSKSGKKDEPASQEVADLIPFDEKSSGSKSTNEDAIASKPSEEVSAESKSPEEAFPLTFDSGIGSCVVSGGEDKSSVLSGGTVESNGDCTELTEPTFSFEWKGNVINEFLQSKNITFGDFGEGFFSKYEDSSKRFEISFGTFFESEKMDDKQKNRCPRKTSAKSKKIKRKAQKNSGAKPDAASGVSLEETEDCEISFVAQLTGNHVTRKAQDLKSVPNEPPKAKQTDSNTSTFDHKSAVKFLWGEWNRTVENPRTKYV